jgi:hypothetical protein
MLIDVIIISIIVRPCGLRFGPAVPYLQANLFQPGCRLGPLKWQQASVTFCVQVKYQTVRLA